MEHQIIKQMKEVIFILCFVLLGCNSKKNRIEVLYFKHSFSTPVSVLCNGIYHHSNLKRIVVFNKEEVKLLTNTINQLKDYTSEYNVDVRRQLIVNNDTICFDRFKQILFNGASKDTINAVRLYDLLDSLITKYDHTAKTYNKLPEIILD